MKTLKIAGAFGIFLVAIAWYFSMDRSEQHFYIGLWIMGGAFLVYAATQWNKSQDRAADTLAAVERIESQIAAMSAEVDSIKRAVGRLF